MEAGEKITRLMDLRQCVYTVRSLRSLGPLFELLYNSINTVSTFWSRCTCSSKLQLIALFDVHLMERPRSEGLIAAEDSIELILLR